MARNTRAVASQRSIRRVSLGSVGADGRTTERWLASACKSSHFPLENKAERIYKLPRNASHIIGKEDQEQAKLSERHPRPTRQVFQITKLPSSRITSVTQPSSTPGLEWLRGLSVWPPIATSGPRPSHSVGRPSSWLPLSCHNRFASPPSAM